MKIQELVKKLKEEELTKELKEQLVAKLTEEIFNKYPELRKDRQRLEEKIKHVADEKFIASLKEGKADNALTITLETLAEKGEINNSQGTYHFVFSENVDEKKYPLDTWVEHATNQYSVKKKKGLRRFAIKAKSALRKEVERENNDLKKFYSPHSKIFLKKVVTLMKEHGEIRDAGKSIEFVDTEVDKLNDTLKESCLNTLGNQHGLNDKEVLRYMVNVMLNMKWNDSESKKFCVFAEKDIESKQAGFNKWVLRKLEELEYIKEDVREKEQYKFRFPRKFTQRKDSLFKKYKKWREDIVKDLAQKCNLSSTATRLLEKHAALIYEHKEKEGDNKTPLERLQLLLHREKTTTKEEFQKELMQELEKQGIILNETAKTLTGINKAEDDEFIATLVSALSEDITPKPDAEQLKQKVKCLLEEDPGYLEIIYQPDFHKKVGGYSESKGFYTLSSWIKKKEAREKMIKEMVKVFPKDAKTTEQEKKQLEEAVKELWRKTENDTSRPNINGDSNIDEYNTLKTWTIGKLEEEGKIKVKRGKKRSIKKVSLIDPNSNEAHIKRTTTLGAARGTGIFGTLKKGRGRASSSFKSISLSSTGLLRRSRRTSAAEVDDQSKKKSSALSFKLRSPRTLREKPVDVNDFHTPSNQPPVTQQDTLGKRKEKKKIGCKRPSTTG